jgi:four helix bundle protein
VESLAVYQKWEDAAEYLYYVFANLPKSERYTMGASLRGSLFACGASISRANRIRSVSARIAEIKDADRALMELKVMLRLAHRMRFVSPKKYEISAGKLAELGRLLGGWLKSFSTQGR